ncbi:hypothetical protein DRQ32_04940 [bacterium]|nr:MAG: hypothetical protein DRQ32_04940 [bacterium]
MRLNDTAPRGICLTILVLALTVAGCGEPAVDSTSAKQSADAAWRISPTQPLAGNQLRVQRSTASGVQLVSAGGLEDSDLLWSVNGESVGRGPSISPGLYGRGDRVSVRLASDAEETERAWVVVGNTPPEIQGLSVTRDPTNPSIARVILGVTDSDGDELKVNCIWNVDGVVLSNASGTEIQIAENAREISVTVVVSAGERTVSRSSTAAVVVDHAPTLEIAEAPSIIDEGGERWAELEIHASSLDPGELRIEVRGGPAYYDAARGAIRWPLIDGSEEFKVTVRVISTANATAERTLILKR